GEHPAGRVRSFMPRFSSFHHENRRSVLAQFTSQREPNDTPANDNHVPRFHGCILTAGARSGDQRLPRFTLFTPLRGRTSIASEKRNLKWLCLKRSPSLRKSVQFVMSFAMAQAIQPKKFCFFVKICKSILEILP